MEEEMNTTILRIIGWVLFFILIFATGIWVKAAGVPYSSTALNVHKLISLVAAVVFGITIYQINKVSGLHGIQTAVVALAGVLLLAAIVSGGLTSIDTMPKFVLRIHQATLALAAIGTAASLYLLLRK